MNMDQYSYSNGSNTFNQFESYQNIQENYQNPFPENNTPNDLNTQTYPYQSFNEHYDQSIPYQNHKEHDLNYQEPYFDEMNHPNQNNNNIELSRNTNISFHGGIHEPTNDIELLRNCVETSKISEYHLKLCETIVENYSKHCMDTLYTYDNDYKSLMSLLEKMSKNPSLYPKEEMIEIKNVIKNVIKNIEKILAVINSDKESKERIKRLRCEINDRYAEIEQFNNENGLLDRISNAREILKRGQIQRKKKYVIECLKMIGVQIKE